MIDEIMGWAEKGHKHDIPTCCGIRFGLSRVFPIRYWVDSLIQPTPLHGLADRIQTLTPGHAYAAHFGEGYIPCEYHLVRWLLTGRKPIIKQDEDGE